ncbi:MAG: hypothetical protein RL685_4452, partial [Pseudomonadota bacterium]
ALQAHLETRATDVTVAPAAHERLVKLVGHAPTPQQIDALIGHEALSSIAGSRQVEVSVLHGRVRTTLVIEGQGTSAQPDVQLIRTLRRSNGQLVAHHDLIKLAERLQDADVGSRIISAQLAAYEQLGVSLIDLEAAWIGRYYWPKLGFDLASPRAVQRYVGLFRGYLEKKGLAPEVVSNLTVRIRTMQDIALIRIGDRLLGKDFLAGDPLDPANPKGQRHPAAAGGLIEGLVMRVAPGDPIYDRMKRELAK